MLVEYGLTREELEQLALQACAARFHYDLADCLEDMPDQELIDFVFRRACKDCSDGDKASIEEVPPC